MGRLSAIARCGSLRLLPPGRSAELDPGHCNHGSGFSGLNFLTHSLWRLAGTLHLLATGGVIVDQSGVVMGFGFTVNRFSLCILGAE
jgi:hypothetical protein